MDATFLSPRPKPSRPHPPHPSLGILLPYPQRPQDEQKNLLEKTPPSMHRAPGGQTAIRLKQRPGSSEPCSSPGRLARR